MNKLTGKTVLITGGGSGIGKGIAQSFASEGAHLILIGRRKTILETTKKEFENPNLTHILQADVTVESEVNSVFKYIENNLGKLDILINNAGVVEGGPLDTMDIATWDKVMSINVRGPFLCTRAALKMMKPKGSGRIINIGSLAGSRVRANSGPYAASKHAIWGLTQVTALEGQKFGISCSCINPGNVMVERRIEGKREMDKEPMMSVKEIGKVALTMALMPPEINLLESTILPINQEYIGRG